MFVPEVSRVSDAATAPGVVMKMRTESLFPSLASPFVPSGVKENNRRSSEMQHLPLHSSSSQGLRVLDWTIAGRGRNFPFQTLAVLEQCWEGISLQDILFPKVLKKKKKVQMVCDISKRSKSTKALKFLLDSALGRVCPDFVHD